MSAEALQQMSRRTLVLLAEAARARQPALLVASRWPPVPAGAEWAALQRRSSGLCTAKARL